MSAARSERRRCADALAEALRLAYVVDERGLRADWPTAVIDGATSALRAMRYDVVVGLSARGYAVELTDLETAR